MNLRLLLKFLKYNFCKYMPINKNIEIIRYENQLYFLSYSKNNLGIQVVNKFLHSIPIDSDFDMFKHSVIDTFSACNKMEVISLNFQGLYKIYFEQFNIDYNKILKKCKFYLLYQYEENYYTYKYILKKNRIFERIDDSKLVFPIKDFDLIVKALYDRILTDVIKYTAL